MAPKPTKNQVPYRPYATPSADKAAAAAKAVPATSSPLVAKVATAPVKMVEVTIANRKTYEAGLNSWGPGEKIRVTEAEAKRLIKHGTVIDPEADEIPVQPGLNVTNTGDHPVNVSRGGKSKGK